MLQPLPNRVLQKKQLAAELGVCEKTVTNLMKSGGPPEPCAQAATHTGDHEGWLFPPDRKVERWADRVNRLINQDTVALFNDDADGQSETGDSTKWGWTFHWLRQRPTGTSPPSPARARLRARRRGSSPWEVTTHEAPAASPVTAHDVA